MGNTLDTFMLHFCFVLFHWVLKSIDFTRGYFLKHGKLNSDFITEETDLPFSSNYQQPEAHKGDRVRSLKDLIHQ